MSECVTNVVTASTAGDYYPYYPSQTQVIWPSTYYVRTNIPVDRGDNAFKLAQALVAKHLVEAKSATQFIALMNAILEVI